MVHHVWTILCEQVLANQRTRELSYINSTHQSVLRTDIEEGKLANITPLIVAIKWFKSSGKKETIDLRVSIEDAKSDEVVVISETKMDFNANIAALAISMGIEALPIKHEGLHFILVEYKPQKNKKWKHGSTSPLNIISEKEKIQKA